MNRIKSFLMAAVLLITGINFQGLTAYAAKIPEISSENIKAEGGMVVSVPINISGNQGIMGFTIDITYEKETFTPVEVTSSELLSDGSLIDSIETSTTDSFQVTWAGNSDMNEDGVLFYVSFRVAEYARGNYRLGLSYRQSDTYNEKWEDVALGCKDISVTVTSPVIEHMYLSSTDNLAAEAGSRIEIPVKIANNKETKGLRFHLQYDTSVFHFEEAEYKLAAGGSVTPQKDGLQIELTQIDVSQEQGILLLCFFSVEEYVSGKYIFHIESEDAETLDFMVSVNNPHSGEAAKICGGKITKDPDGSIKVPVLIQNNPGIMGLRITVAYDDKILRPIDVKQGTLLQGNFDDNIGNKAGEYSILWNETENVWGNGELFVASFQIEESANAASTVISLSYSISDTFNEDMQDIGLECQDIIINLPELQESKTPHQITLQSSFKKKRGDKTFNLNAKSPTGAKLSYISDHNKVVQVDENGNITIIGVGKAEITVSASANENYTAFSEKTVITVVPDIVTGLKLKSASAGTVSASWKRESAYSGYELRYSVNSNMSPNKKTLQSKGESAKLKGLSGKIYYVQIRAFEEADGVLYYGGWSKKGSIIVKPETVRGVKAKPLAGGKARISWKKAANISGYQVRYSKKSNMKSGKMIKIKGKNKIKATLKKLKKGKKYYIQVRAYRTAGKKTCYGNWSKKVKII